MTDWGIVADLGTAGGTALLAVATFSSTRSANRAARSAERSVLEGLRPLLLPSRWQDPVQKVRFVDERWVRVEGSRGALETTSEAVYLVMSLRNVGHGLAVLHGWDIPAERTDPPRAPDAFHRLTRDLYVSPGEPGFWQGSVRDPSDPLFGELTDAVRHRSQVLVDLLYGDTEGGQRTISRFAMTRGPADTDETDTGTWALSSARHWRLDQPDPR